MMWVGAIASIVFSVATGIQPVAITLPSAPPSQGFVQPQLSWSDCSEVFECATLQAPLDWSRPKGGTISLALIKKPAIGTSKGSIFFNPGGPGGSGIELVRGGSFDPELSRNYDLVGFDPRGVGQSSSVDCLTPSELTRYLAGPEISAPRGSPQWISDQKAAATAFAQACVRNTGKLLGHVDTVSAARDLDLMRRAVGEDKLNFLGFSYGTFLGATYAGLFPQNVGRFVLDGAVDPSLDAQGMDLSQAKGFELALRHYLRDCLGQVDCPFAGLSVDDAAAYIRSLLDTAETDPLVGSDGRELTADTLVSAIIGPLYAKALWGILTQVLAAVLNGNADPALAQADNFSEVNDPNSNLMEANRAINCLDYTYDARPAALARDRAELEAVAPVFGTYFAYSQIGCSVWPFKATQPRTAISAEGSPLILVVGTTGDPATPYEQAQSLASQLSNARLLTFDGEGHTAYATSACVNSAVNSFLLRGTAPAVGKVCKQ